MQQMSQEIAVWSKDPEADDLQAKHRALQAKIQEQKGLVQEEFLHLRALQKKLKEQSYAEDSLDSAVAATGLMKRGKLHEEGIPGVYSPEKIQKMMAERMSERFIRQLAKEKLKCCIRLSEDRQHRQAAEQQPQGMPVPGSKNDAYETAEETMNPEAMRKQKTRSETSKSQTTSDRPTKTAATYTQTQMVSKTSREVSTKSEPTKTPTLPNFGMAASDNFF
uniref:Uncharacterized protein n=1 Tax=Romanomermis culicivorax TaxID=13658 RepID=A0A915IAG4_ROMCU